MKQTLTQKEEEVMMHTKKTNKWMRLGYAFCIPMLLGTLCFCTNRAGGSTEEESVQTAETVTKSNEEQTVSLQQLDEKPQFEGGEAPVGQKSRKEWAYMDSTIMEKSTAALANSSIE